MHTSCILPHTFNEQQIAPRKSNLLAAGVACSMAIQQAVNMPHSHILKAPPSVRPYRWVLLLCPLTVFPNTRPANASFDSLPGESESSHIVKTLKLIFRGT